MADELCREEWDDLVAFYAAYLAAKDQFDKLEPDYEESLKRLQEACGPAPLHYVRGESSHECTAARSAFDVVFLLYMEAKEMAFNAREGLIESWHRYQECKHAQLEDPQ